MDAEKSRGSLTSARRRNPNQSWSAASSVELFDGAGAKVTDVATARKATVRWRHSGRNRKRTFTGRHFADDAREFRALLVAAYEGDWGADEGGRPLPPVALPVAAPTADIIPIRPETAALPTVPATKQPGTVEELAAWYWQRLITTPTKKGKPRSGKSLGSYESTLAYIVEYLRYQPGDIRLGPAGAQPGDSLRLDETFGLATIDLLEFIDERAAVTRLTAR